MKEESAENYPMPVVVAHLAFPQCGVETERRDALVLDLDRDMPCDALSPTGAEFSVRRLLRLRRSVEGVSSCSCTGATLTCILAEELDAQPIAKVPADNEVGRIQKLYNKLFSCISII